MKCFRRWLLILSAIVLGGSQVFAASREERAFAAASAAFQDGFYDRAEAEFAQFCQRYPKSARVAEALLFQAQAQFHQKKFTAAIALLSAPRASPSPLADRYAYWLGEAQFGQGDFERALATFASLPEKFPGSPLCLTAVVEAAATMERLGDWPGMEELLGRADSIFALLAAKNSGSELVVRGRLLLAQALLAQGKFSAALATLNAVELQALTPALDWQRANLLCRVQAGTGDLEAALGAATNLLQLARSQCADRLADSVAWHGTVLERLGRWADAAEAWKENLTNTAPSEWQREAVLRIAGAAMVRRQFADAESALELYLAKYSNAPAADLARLTLGEMHLKEYMADSSATNRLALARARFDQVLDATNSPTASSLAGKAFLDRGWYYWLAGHPAESLADFAAAAARLPFSEDLAVAHFKAGDAQFALKEYAAARQSYQSLLEQFSGVPAIAKSLGDRALYQILRANLELKDMAGADMAMRQMLEKFPASDLADNSLLLLGEGFSETGATGSALKTFRDFAVLFPESPLTPQVELARARALEGAQDWPSAITNYQDWLISYPTNELRPQVEYALGRACFQAGNETNALMVFTNFVARFPTNDLAPLAQWWVADFYFRQGGTSYAEAEKNYELIFQTPAWRKSDLFYPAQLMAGRAAAGRLGFADAANYLAKLLADTNCPPPLKTQALFAYGGVLMRMDSADTNHPFANFELATNVFAQLYLANATNEHGALASSELGDCNLQLGAYDAATNAYVQVINSPYAGAGLRSRAQVGLGRVLEKKAELAAPDKKQELLAQAMKNYLDVLYADPGAADPFWTKKAGLQALPLMSALKTGDTDKFIDRLEYWLPQLKEALEKKRAALKN